MFARWGLLVYRFRRLTLALSLLLLVLTGALLARGGALAAAGLNSGEAARALSMIDAELPHAGGSTFDLIFGSASLKATDPRFKHAVQAALAPLLRDSHVSAILTSYNAPAASAGAMESRDGRDILAVVSVRDSGKGAGSAYPRLRALVRSSSLQVLATGELAVNHDFDRILGQDLQRAERVSLPLALVLLLIVFGTVVAALLPLGVGVLALVGGLAGVFLLSRFTDVSQYALNIVTLIGLGVAIDYSLFVVNRFREELERGVTVEQAVARAMSTAGRAIAFSGLTVGIGLSGMLFYQGTFLASMGLAGTVGVAFAVVYGLTFLPAMLSLLGPRVNRWRLPWPRARAHARRGLWSRLAMGVMRRPLLVLALTLPLVLLAGSPFLQLRLAGADIGALPPAVESHRGYDLLRAQFPGSNATEIDVVVRYSAGHPLSARHVASLYDLSRRIARIAGVSRVESLVDLGPSFDRAGYQRLYAAPRALLPARVASLVRQTTGTHIVLLNVFTPYAGDSDAARAIVRDIRRLRAPAQGQILVTGRTAIDVDSIHLILSDTPAAVGYIMIATYVVLFLLLGSVILPLKAVITDVLSISASFGALVWIFQQGHLSGMLHFSPAAIDPTVPVLLFCIVFGLSMDYEVLLLSRMKEAYDQSGDNRAAVAEGLERSGRLITGAAAIMVAVFLAFALADVVLIKAIGLGMAVAVAIDATIVRALIVPAIMRLLGPVNWWAPRPLANLYRRLNLAETEQSMRDVA